MKKTFLLLIASLILVSCGGGGGGGGGSDSGSSGATSDLFQNLIGNVFTGGYRNVVKLVTDSGGERTSSCGYMGAFYDRAMVEENLAKQGGSVTSSSSTEWCATAAGESHCLKQFDRVFVFDNRYQSPQKTTVELYMTGLVANHMTVIDFDSLTYNSFNGQYEPLALLESPSLDTSILEGAVLAGGASCGTQPQPTQTKEAIDGNWAGYKATYSLITMSGSTAAATVSCVNQSCTTSDLAGVPFTLSEFSSDGGWRTAVGAPKLAGAVISTDRQLLSMFVCNTPLDESKTFENCSFFTLKR